MRSIARVIAGASIVLAACGRLGFDGASDGGVDPLLAGCVLELAVDEAAWTTAPGQVTTRCGANVGTVRAEAQVVVDATRGRVVELGGGDDCLLFRTAPVLEPTDQLTLSAWVFAIDTDDEPHGIIAKRVAFQNDSQFTLYLHTADHAFVDINDNAERAESAAVVPRATWQQLTMVFDGRLPVASRIAFYVDGALDGTAPDADPTIAMLGAPLAIGCLPNGLTTPQAFIGRLDEVVMWTRALDATEVDAWYDRTRL